MLDAILGGVGSAIAGSLFGGGSGGKGAAEDAKILENLQKAGDKNLQSIDQYLATILSGTADQYGKSAAISDSMGAIANLFTQYQNTALPQIYQSEAGSGGYNSTTGQLLANDAFASAINKAAELQLNTIQKYRGLQQADYQTFANLIAAMPRSGGAASAAVGKSDPLSDLLTKGAGSLGGALGTSLEKSDWWRDIKYAPEGGDYGQYF